MNVFEQRRLDNSVPADANGAFAFVGRLQGDPLSDLSPSELTEVLDPESYAASQPSVIRTVADLQRSLGLAK